MDYPQTSSKKVYSLLYPSLHRSPSAAFRIDRVAFEILLTKLRSTMGESSIDREKQATRSSGSPVSLTTRLAMALRWLAGGSYWNICGLYGVSAGTSIHLHTSITTSMTYVSFYFLQAHFILNVVLYGPRYMPSTRHDQTISHSTFLSTLVVGLQTASQSTVVGDLTTVFALWTICTITKPAHIVPLQLVQLRHVILS